MLILCFLRVGINRDFYVLIGVDGEMDRGKGGNARLYRDSEELSLQRLMALLGAGYVI